MDVKAELEKNTCSDPAGCVEKREPCYIGQWTVHGPHHYELRRQLHLGGGTIQVHCNGKTAETKL